MSFGDDLRRLRGDRPQTEIATLALGAHASEVQIRDLANYLSRIERDRIPNVGLAKLRVIAKGFGFHTLAKFFAAIEEGSQSSVLRRTQAIADNAPHPFHRVTDDAAALPSALDAVAIEASIISAAEVLGGRLDGLAAVLQQLVAHVAASDRQVATARPVTTRRRARHSRRARKAS